MIKECSRVVTDHDSCANLRDVDVCMDFEIFEVKVPINFLGTAGVSLRRDGRYRR
jgi:hypothetical protein